MVRKTQRVGHLLDAHPRGVPQQVPRLPYRKGFQPLHGRTPRLRLDHLRQVTRKKRPAHKMPAGG